MDPKEAGERLDAVGSRLDKIGEQMDAYNEAREARTHSAFMLLVTVIGVATLLRMLVSP